MNIEHGIKQPNNPMHLGIDIGRVIIADDTDNPSRRIFGDDFVEAPEIPGAIESIAEIGQSGQYESIKLVSKCGAVVQTRSMQWLLAHGFFDITNLRESDVHFCLTRPEKAIIAHQLGLTAFVDDRPDVLESLSSKVTKKILLAQQGSDTVNTDSGNNIMVAKNWGEVRTHLLH